MKQNLYYRAVVARKLISPAASIVLRNAMRFRMILEVFIRKNFGERYFSMVSVYSWAFLLMLVPFFSGHGTTLFYMLAPGGQYIRFPFSEFMADNGLWYGFVAAFVLVSYKRNQETKHNPSVFDFAKFSLYSGDINPRFFSLFGRQWDVRQVETFVEPAFCFLTGCALCFFSAKLGIFILICSLFYSYSYMVAYEMSDHFVMDKIDEMISNERMYKTFVEDVEEGDNKGFRFSGRKPADPEFRRKLAETFIEVEDENVAFAT